MKSLPDGLDVANFKGLRELKQLSEEAYDGSEVANIR